MFESIKKKLFGSDDAQVIASYPCVCANRCNKGLVLLGKKDKELLEVVIDWRLSAERPKDSDMSVGVLVSRQFLLDNIIRSGEPLSDYAKFQYDLDRYFAEMAQSKSSDGNIKMPTEYSVQELINFINDKVLTSHEEYKK